MARGIKVEKVVIHMRGVEEAFRSGGVVNDMRKRAERIRDAANAGVEERYPDNGYESAEHYAVQEYTTTHGNVGFNVHGHTQLGNRAQAAHGVLTQAIDAGRG